jgi:uncharacterized membrane protein
MKILKKYETTIIITALILINFLVKVVFLSYNSLGNDEPFSVYHAQMDIASIIKLLSSGNNPPLYEIILHFWIKIFGISEFSVRFPSLIFSCITVLFIYKLGIKHLNKRIALYASIIFIFSNYQILFAHEARVYAFLGMLSVLSMYYFLNVINECKLNTDTGSKNLLNIKINKNLIILLLVNILIIYSHYFGFFILITQFLFLLFNWKLFLKYWRQITICIGIILIFYIPNIIVFFYRLITSSVNGTWVSTPNGFESLYNMLWQFSNAPVVTIIVISIFIISLIKYIIKLIIRKKSKQYNQVNLNYQLMFFWFIFIFFFMFGISYFVPMFLDRYLMPASIAFCFVLSISANYLIENPKFRYIIPIIICVLFIATTKPNITNKRNVKETVEKVKEIKNENTLVLICPQHFIINFVYYYDIEMFKDYNTKNIYANIDTDLKNENIYGINNISEINFKKYNNIVFLDAAANFSFPNNNINNELDANYSLKNEYKFYEIFKVLEYESK